MRTSIFCRVVALVYGCIAALAVATAADLTIIDLRNRTAAEIIPMLRPMVGSDVALSGVDYKLLVRGGNADVARIREVLAVLDRAPRQLLVSVRYAGSPQDKSSEFGADARINRSGVAVDARGGIVTGTTADSSISSVRVLEGNSALISTGQSVPIVTSAYVPTQTSRGSGVGISTDYRDIASGFSVLPRINGDRVVLEISAQQQRLSDSTAGAITTQRATTTVMGRLGEWIDLGGVVSSIEEQRTSVGVAGGGRRVATQSDRRSIAVKVDSMN